VRAPDASTFHVPFRLPFGMLFGIVRSLFIGFRFGSSLVQMLLSA
jgi:hypothetical protein